MKRQDYPSVKMPVTEAIKELRKLKSTTYADYSVSHTIVTKTQSEILKALGIDTDELLAMRVGGS